MTQGKQTTPIAYKQYVDRRTARTPLLMVHGRGASGAQFDLVAQALAKEGYWIITVDLPGHGASSVPNNWSLKAFAEAIHTLMTEHLHIERFDLFGHSLGGVIALEYIKQYPTHVRNLVVMGTHLETMSIYPLKIALDKGSRALLGDTFLYSAYLAFVWCRGSIKTFRSLRAVSGKYDVQRDLSILETIAPYDYFSELVEFEQEGGKISMVVCDQDTLINADLPLSFEFMEKEVSRKVVRIAGGHYTHLIDPYPLVGALKELLS